MRTPRKVRLRRDFPRKYGYTAAEMKRQRSAHWRRPYVVNICVVDAGKVFILPPQNLV